VLTGPGKGGLFRAIALDAKGGLHVLTKRLSLYSGVHHYKPKGGKWTATKVPFNPALYGLAATPSGDLLALNYGDKQQKLSVHKLSAKGWKLDTVLIKKGWNPYKSSKDIRHLISDSAGCLHARRMENGKVFYMQRGISGSWKEQITPIKGNMSMNTRLVLSPSGVPFISYVKHYLLPELSWWKFGGAKGHLLKPPKGIIPWFWDLKMAITGSGSAKVLHFLLHHKTSSNDYGLLYLYRKGGAWSYNVLGTDGSPNCGTCVAGSKCAVDFYYYSSLGLVASGSGDVRLFYLRNRVSGDMVGTMKPVGSTQYCRWQGGTLTGSLHVAWLAGGKIQNTSLKAISTIRYEEFQAVLDKSGDIYLGYTSDDGPPWFPIHHMVIGK